MSSCNRQKNLYKNKNTHTKSIKQTNKQIKNQIKKKKRNKKTKENGSTSTTSYSSVKEECVLQKRKPGATLRKAVGVQRNRVLSSAQDGDPCVYSANTGRDSKFRWRGGYSQLFS